MMRGTAVSGGQQRRATWNTFAGIPWQVGGGKGYLEHFRGNSVPGGRQRRTPGTLSREYRARWAAGRCYLTRFRGNSVAGGRRERTPGTLSQENRGRWTAGRDTWNAFAGIPCQVGSGMRHLEHFRRKTVAGGQREGTPGTLSRGNRGRWKAEKDTWNVFAGIPWQVGGGEMPPGTFSRGYRGRWAAGKATWNAFAGKPWQVDGRKSYLERFRRDAVTGGRRERLPGTLSREFRGRWTAGKATWHAFAGKPWQVGGGKGHLERFHGDSVPGRQQEVLPDTLLRGYSATLPDGKFYWDMKLNLC